MIIVPQREAILTREVTRTDLYVIEEHHCIDKHGCMFGCQHKWYSVTELQGYWCDQQHTFVRLSDARRYARTIRL